MDVSRKRTSGRILSTSPHKTVYGTVYTQGRFLSVCLSVDAEGSVALLTLAGEVSNQLTIADHQKQATSCGTTQRSSIKKN